MKKQVIKIAVFFSILCVLLVQASVLFREKQTNNRLKESTTDWVNEFYMLPENSLDLLFLGTSHSFCTIDPNQLWHEAGITSYSLASSAQDMNASLLYMKEALKTQKPKAIFVEMRGAVWADGTEERWNRLAYDNMPASWNKYQAVLKSKKDDESLLSYFFPVFRYHYRWKNIEGQDFQYLSKGARENHYSLNGFFLRQKITPVSFEHYYDPKPEGWNGLSESVKRVILEMQDICSKEGIILILWKAPTPMWRDYYHQSIASFAEKNEIPYMDLNLCLDDIGLDCDTDFLDENSHLNFSGAKKVTAYLTDWLLQENQFDDKKLDENGVYDNWAINYQYYLQTILLTGNYTLPEYLMLIKQPEYQVFFAVNDGVSKVPEEIQSALKNFGFNSSFEGADVNSFMAVVDSGELIYEKMSESALSGTFQVNHRNVQMESKGYYVGDDASIKIDENEYLLDTQRGLGIVVYDKILDKVIDSVTFDIKNNGKCYRNNNIE